jgi:hypothetical protein
LSSFDVDLEQTRKEILHELDPNISPSGTDPNAVSNPKEGKAMKSSCEMPQDPKSDPVDTSKRYDVYCSERNAEGVVYRNARFKGLKGLFQSRQFDFMSQFIELEQADGKAIFLSRHSVIKFCEPGVTPGDEKISPPKP